MSSKNSKSAPIGTVVVTRYQVVRYQGRHVAEVREEDDGIFVRRKRDRGGQYDEHFYPSDRVVAYAAGEGGTQRSSVFAVVHDLVVLARYEGEIVRNDTSVSLVIDDRETGDPLQVVLPLRRDDGCVMSVTLRSDKPEARTRGGTAAPRPDNDDAAFDDDVTVDPDEDVAVDDDDGASDETYAEDDAADDDAIDEDDEADADDDYVDDRKPARTPRSTTRKAARPARREERRPTSRTTKKSTKPARREEPRPASRPAKKVSAKRVPLKSERHATTAQKRGRSGSSRVVIDPKWR